MRENHGQDFYVPDDNRSRMAAFDGSQNTYAATSLKEKMASDKKESTEW
jgi:hypothetical protein